MRRQGNFALDFKNLLIIRCFIVENFCIMIKYKKISAFDRHANLGASIFGDFSSVSDAITTILYYKFGLCYGNFSEFAGWTFHLTPQDACKCIKKYTITSGGKFRLLK